jgi:hypothetical protein
MAEENTLIEGIWDPLQLNEEKRQGLIDHIHRQIFRSDRDRTRYIQNLRRSDTLYEGHGRRTKNTPFEGASDVHIPQAATHTTAIHSRLFTTMTGQPNFFIGRALDRDQDGGGDGPLERRMGSFNIWLQWVLMELMDWESQVYTFLHDATRYPLGVMRIGWNKKEGPWIHYDAGGRIIKENKVISSSPEVKAWPPEDFYWPLAFDDVQNGMPWVAFRSWLTAGQARSLVVQKKLFNIDSSIQRLGRRSRARGIQTPSGLELKEKRERQAGIDLVDTPLLELHEMWIDYEIEDGKGEQKLRVIYDPIELPTLESLKLLGLHPHMHQRWPCVVSSYERRPHTLPGLGVPLQIGDMNDILDTIHNQNLDQAHVATVDLIGMPNAQPYTDQLARIWPGKRVALPDPDKVKPIPLGTLKASSVGLEGHIRNYMERRTFLSDFAMGREPTPSRRGTATGTIALIQEGNKHFDASMKDIRRGLTEAGYQIIELCAQLMPRSFIEDALGRKVADDVDFVIRNATGTIRQNVGLSVAATSAVLNKDTQRQNSMLLFNVATSYYQQLFTLAQMMTQPGMTPGLKKLASVLSEKAANLMAEITKTFDRHPDELVPDQKEIDNALFTPEPTVAPGGAPGVEPVPGAAQPGVSAAPPSPPTGLLTAIDTPEAGGNGTEGGGAGS